MVTMVDTPVSKFLDITRTNLINWVARYANVSEGCLEDGLGKNSLNIEVIKNVYGKIEM